VTRWKGKRQVSENQSENPAWPRELVKRGAAERAPALKNRLKIPFAQPWSPCESEARFQNVNSG